MVRKIKDGDEIEVGDFVTIIGGERDGLTGIYDNEFVRDGERLYVVTFGGEDFAYAPAIRLYKKVK